MERKPHEEQAKIAVTDGASAVAGLGRPPDCSAPPRLRAAKPSETLAPGAESTYNNQPNGDLCELTKKNGTLWLRFPRHL